MVLRPFFSFFGSKWAKVPQYPNPSHCRIIEPFAGSASYSLHYPQHEVYLNDLDPAISSTWEFLIKASEFEILALPLTFESVDDIKAPIEARRLIGFWLNRQNTHPCKSASLWMRSGKHPYSFWGESVRNRIAKQVQHIRHWKISENDYQNLPLERATWFIDPPYSTSAGRSYVKQVSDYSQLATWCKSRLGQTIVCEQEGASWLPFSPLGNFRSVAKKISKEVIWVNGGTMELDDAKKPVDASSSSSSPTEAGG